MAGFPLSRFAFNRFARGNRRLPCSTLSGVTCHTSTRRRRRRAFDLLGYRTATSLRRPQPHPSPCPIRHTAGSGIGGRSGSESTANRTRITAPVRAKIGGLLPRNRGTDRHPADGKAAPYPSAARKPKPTAKGRTQNTPATRVPSRTLTRSQIVALARPETRTAATLFAGQITRCSTWPEIPIRPRKSARALESPSKQTVRPLVSTSRRVRQHTHREFLIYGAIS